MKRAVLLALLMASLAGIALSGSTPGDSKIANLPPSLDKLYPPQSPGPVYKQSMLRLANTFTGLVADVLENDQANTAASYAAFAQCYDETAAMVPEWKAQYPLEPLDGLKATLASGDPGQIMPAVEKLGGVCHHCHVATMVPVQQKYLWGRFADLSVTDPLSGQDFPYAKFMLMLQTNFAGIGNDLAQGQLENAKQQFAGFSARFGAMAESCEICHDTERHYFVDSGVTDRIAALGAALNSPTPDPGQAGKLMQAIGQESCSKCHMVHFPAAHAQEALALHNP